LLARAGIHDDPYFALTELVGSKIAALTEAPGARPRAEGAEQKQLDKAMAAVDQLRLNGKLGKLLPNATPVPTHEVAHDDGAARHADTGALP
jgi:hypothetical protein